MSCQHVNHTFYFFVLYQEWKTEYNREYYKKHGIVGGVQAFFGLNLPNMKPDLSHCE